ncbi:hypothetical protein [Azospirillum sp. sgz302134]
MRTVPAEEFAADLPGWMARINASNDGVIVVAPDGSQVVVIPDAWWLPAAEEPPPEPPPPPEGQPEWDE